MKTHVIPWDRFFQREEDDYQVFEVLPTTSVRNNQAYVLAAVIADWYRKPSELRRWGTKPILMLGQQYKVNFRILLQHDSIRFFFLVPRAKANEFVRKAEAIYDANITIEPVDGPLPALDPGQAACVEIGYRKHDIFSADTDRSHNYPLPSLLSTVRLLEPGDMAIFDALLEPTDRMAWIREARQAHNQLEKGYVPAVGWSTGALVWVHQLFSTLRDELISATRFTKDQEQEYHRWKFENSQWREAYLIRQDMTPATKRKQGQDVLRVWMRAAAQADNAERARAAAYTLGNAWKDLNADNSLEITEIPTRWNAQYISSIEGRRPFSIRFRADRLSTEEAGKLLQLPGRDLIQEFPQINARKHLDVEIPTELTAPGIKRVPLGVVTVRGRKVQVGIPLEAYSGVKLQAVYDALCTASLGQGMQGSGKSEGYGSNWAYYMAMAGFSVFIIDTADGQVLRNFVNSLPEDFPDEKLHLLNLDNKAWPVPLGWTDVYGRNFAAVSGDDELAAMEIQERITSRLVSFINGLSATGEFTDRMQQYVVSAMRAITTSKAWEFLDLELALTSPAYREQLLTRSGVQAQPDVVRDLTTLQERAADGKVGAIIDPILSRLKALSSTQFMANMFLQPPMFKGSEPVLDFRRIMDNPEGSYGHVVCIQASGDAWQGNQAAILGFMLDKINFNAFSRVDIEQSARKPCLVWIDEPHKVIKTIEGGLSGTAVEFRKYRVKNLFTAHSIEQMGAAASPLLDGGVQITSYKTKRLSEFARYFHMFAPYTNAAELYEALPEKWRAINAVRLPSGKTCPAFLADMTAPPGFVKDRSYAWQQSAERYGRPWKKVRDQIQGKRAHYQQADMEWVAAQQEQQVASKRRAK